MPKNPRKPCRYPGCSNLVESGYCGVHRGAAEGMRDEEMRRLYQTREWRRIRAWQLVKEPWCAQCLRANKFVQATDVHHINRHCGDRAEFFNGPLQSLCHSCHSKVTIREVGLASRGGV